AVSRSQPFSAGDPEEDVVEIGPAHPPAANVYSKFRLESDQFGDVLLGPAERRDIAVAEAGPQSRFQPRGQPLDIRAFDFQDVLAEIVDQSAWRSGFDETAFSDERYSVAAVGLLQIVRREQNRHCVMRAQSFDETP